MKLQDLVDSGPSLQKLSHMVLPVRISYKIGKVLSKIQPEIKLHEEKRVKLIKDLGELIDPVADTWKVKEENGEKYQTQYKELGQIEVEIDFGSGKPLEKIKIEELGDIQIEPGVLSQLDWLFE